MNHDEPVAHRAPLQPGRFVALPLGSVKPRGWLLEQLRTQAGRTGRLGDIWPAVGPSSAWLGGNGEDWERGPYYLDGLVPLAFLLRDERLIALARRWVDWTVSSQDNGGWFGPRTNSDWWPRMVMLKALVQFWEATGDDRIIPLVERYLRYQYAQLPQRPLQRWAQARAGENLLIVYWLYDLNGEAFLLRLAEEIRRQSMDWTYLYTAFPHRSFTTRDKVGMETHTVNHAMAVKYPALEYLQTGDLRHRHASALAIHHLMHYHGQAHGMWSGDEHLAGLDPAQAIELCAVVEYMYSLEHLARILGETEWADRLERVAFNALPAGLTADMWGHQYNQQANQVVCSREPRRFTWTGPDSTLFGLEPEFGCCTANYHQGWPKLATSLWAATPAGGLAALVWAPCEVDAPAGGGHVRIDVETEYPFREEIRCMVTPDAPRRFPLEVRIPAWAAGATVEVRGDGNPAERIAGVVEGSYCRIDREWHPGDVVELHLPMELRVVERPLRHAVTVERGPLVFALAVGEAWHRVGGEDPAPTWEVRPTTPWNYALVLDEQHPERCLEVQTSPVGARPFDPAHVPVRLTARGRRVPGWELRHGSAALPPHSPLDPGTPEETVTLLPYGAARLRVAEMPWTRPSRE